MIDNLTVKQTKKLNYYLEKWTKIGLSTEPIDTKSAQVMANYYYANFLKTKCPKIKVASSPLEAWNMLTTEESFSWPYIDGHFSAGYFSFYDFMKEELNAFDNEHWEWYKSTAQFGPFFPTQNVAVITQRPKEIHFNIRKQLHNEQGPAILYVDGFSCWLLNGVNVPKKLVLTKSEDLNVAELISISNAEVRREYVRKMGVDRLIKEGKTIDTRTYTLNKKQFPRFWPLPKTTVRFEYELIDLSKFVGNSYAPYLVMNNPSVAGVYHCEGVHESCKTVEQALKWRNKTDDETFIMLT